MKALSRILAYEGLALIAFAVLTLIFAGEAFLLAFGILLAGILCIAGFLFFGGISFKDRIKSKGAKYGTNAVVYTVIVLALLVAANYMGYRYNKAWDLTSAKLFTLSDQTVKVLDSLDQPVKVVAFLKATEKDMLVELLGRYTRQSDLLEYEIYDPDRNPEIVHRYGATQRGQIVVESSGRSTTILGQNEQELTNAIIKVSKSQQGALYFLEGHGEVPLDSKTERGYYGVKMALENENLVVRPLLLESRPGVPPDCKVLVVGGPRKTLPPNVIGAIDRYLAEGGHALFLLDPQTTSGLGPLVQKYGMTLREDMIVDEQVHLFEGATLGIDPIVSDFTPHEITKNFSEPVVFPRTQSLDVGTATDADIETIALAKTSESSWGESNIEQLIATGDVVFEQGADLRGPLAVAALATKPLPSLDSSGNEAGISAKRETRLIVVGDSDFASNQYINYMFNGPFFMNMLTWLSGEDYLVAIPPRSYLPSFVNLTPKSRQLVFLGSVFLVPQIVLMFGIGALLRRKGR